MAKKAQKTEEAEVVLKHNGGNPVVEPTGLIAQSEIPQGFVPIPTERFDITGFGKAKGPHFQNWPLKTPEDAARLMRCLSKSDESSDTMINRTFFMRNLFIHRVHLTNVETGEIVAMPRVVLINPEGKTLSFCSAGVWGSIEWIVRMYTTGPWNPPIPVIVRKVPCRTAGSTLVLDFDTEHPFPPLNEKMMG